MHHAHIRNAVFQYASMANASLAPDPDTKAFILKTNIIPVLVTGIFRILSSVVSACRVL